MSQVTAAGRSLARISRIFNAGQRSSTLPLVRPSRLYATQQVRCISQSGSNHNGNTPTDGKQGHKGPETGPKASILQRINASLDQMGATRGVKITILIFLSIVGTMETMFYVKAAQRWLYPKDEEDGEGGQK
ncbi:hypothetical protein PM082_006787 [Marasmius tenuissimus]|nr:hypothetical protein PM082_006787 [Marasmius tenuissimus]